MFEHKINEDLSLKLIKMEDCEHLITQVNESRMYLREWLPWVDSMQNSNDFKPFIEGSLNRYIKNDGLQATIWYKREFAGLIGLHGINWPNKSTSIGYWLGAGYQGKGIMTKACHAIIDYSFKELKLNRVEIRVATDNYKSAAIPQRLGFQKEGVIRQAEWLYDHYVDHVVYGLLTDEWK